MYVSRPQSKRNCATHNQQTAALTYTHTTHVCLHGNGIASTTFHKQSLLADGAASSSSDSDASERSIDALLFRSGQQPCRQLPGTAAQHDERYVDNAVGCRDRRLQLLFVWPHSKRIRQHQPDPNQSNSPAAESSAALLPSSTPSRSDSATASAPRTAPDISDNLARAPDEAARCRSAHVQDH